MYTKLRSKHKCDVSAYILDVRQLGAKLVSQSGNCVGNELHSIHIYSQLWF